MGLDLWKRAIPTTQESGDARVGRVDWRGYSAMQRRSPEHGLEVNIGLPPHRIHAETNYRGWVDVMAHAASRS